MNADKFSRLESNASVPHDYGNLFFEEPCGPSFRLVIGPTAGWVDLLIELSAELGGDPRWILYVLLVPRLGHRERGRYQSPPFEAHPELSAFLAAFRGYFEGDGRHHVWIGSAARDGLLVYDQHNVLFAYGPIERFKPILRSRGYNEQEFWFPAPHMHHYHEENDAEEERLMRELEWEYFPLQPGDEWN